jgi:hypothetical protein
VRDFLKEHRAALQYPLIALQDNELISLLMPADEVGVRNKLHFFLDKLEQSGKLYPSSHRA